MSKRTQEPCQRDGCDREVHALGYCKTHYTLRKRSGLMPPRPTTQQRYEAKVDRSGGPDACHPWTASRNKPGYGLFTHDGDTLAARWAYKHYVGPLADGEHIRHTCDNPPCQNRRHWLTGSNYDNQMDKVERNRQHRPTGTRNPKAILDWESVQRIRSESTGVRGEQIRLAAEYGVSKATISEILRNRIWRMRPNCGDTALTKGD